MDINLKNLHLKSMKKLRNILPQSIRIIYSNGKKCIVPCTISDINSELLKYNEYVGKDSKVFNVLIEDLKENDVPINNFMYVEYNRITYQVQSVYNSSIFNNTISLVCLLYKGNSNE